MKQGLFSVTRSEFFGRQAETLFGGGPNADMALEALEWVLERKPQHGVFVPDSPELQAVPIHHLGEEYLVIYRANLPKRTIELLGLQKSTVDE